MLRARTIAKLSRRAALVAAALSLCASMRAAAPLGETTEHELKAVLLFHLTQYVSWPAHVTNRQNDFIIGVLGPDPVGVALEKVVENEKVAGKPIRVARAQALKDLPPCELVYVSRDFAAPLGRTLATLHQRPAFTVGDSDDFIEQGGLVRFKRVANRKLRLEISLDRLRKHGFNVSAQLLRVSEVITTGTTP
jgi:hypothetical protein